MVSIHKRLVDASIALIGFGFSAAATAGAPVMVYGPSVPMAMPLMDSAGLVLLAGLLAVLGMRLHRRGGGGATLAAVLTSALALASAGTGVKLVDQATAIPVATDQLDLAGGGSVPVIGSFLNIYQNTSGVAQVIKDIALPVVCPTYPTGDPLECTLGKVIASEGFCEIDCRDVEE